MTIKVLLSAQPDTVAKFESHLRDAFLEIGLNVDLGTGIAPEQVDYIVYGPNPSLTDFTPFKNVKAVLSLWAGVESIASNPTLTHPLTRMVDSGLREGMIEWVTGHVLRHHLGMDAHINNPNHEWPKDIPPLARNRKVCVLGLGALGAACAQALAALNFDTAGWSRRKKSLDGIKCFFGAEGLDRALKNAEILVLLLPLTEATENLINSRTLVSLPQGAFILNPGRGALIDDDALLESLENGQVAHATLDVFRSEPLPKDHPFWRHPKVTVTPHIASDTRAETASHIIAENILRNETGQPMKFVVDRNSGY